ncbi:poly [ADP-ribose] polymerase [Plakobranchus ocellatus]|uniref:Poly [ADP-ribose] polymerase n=1 Tax=Plakobranchus ocellatus TaxID=259542 RepID=A0AAV3YIW4_9GAST|nr:poly [ADP-ribose] polymerase [Plakobranchus ocellatus]
MFNGDLKGCNSKALQLARAAEVVRKENIYYYLAFNGRFPNKCQERSVPAVLKALITFILDGPAAQSNQALLTIPRDRLF